MAFSESFIRVFRTLLPSPFAIAIGLTAITFWLAFFTTQPDTVSSGEHLLSLLGYWKDGIGNAGGLQFAMQMMLMLVLGHVVALTKPVTALIDRVVRYCTTTSVAAALVTFLTVLVALFNWGFGLIFGAIFARKVGEQAAARGHKLNYALIGASGYSGLMVWHGGISGSSLAKVNEPGHLASIMEANGASAATLAALPDTIDFGQTVFSTGNIGVMLALLLVLPMGMFLLGKRIKSSSVSLRQSILDESSSAEQPTGAERLDHVRWTALLFGLIVLGYALYDALLKPGADALKFFNPNNINFLLLGLGIVLHGNFHRFLGAVTEAIGGATGILIQFPLYFGIMGIMQQSGLAEQVSQSFANLAGGNPESLPFYTFFSAGLVNVFVPSGGGQWAVQGPIIVQSAIDLGLDLPKSVMAMAYGDQLTNMMQPFWALPLLGITGLKAKEILPYTLYLMLLGTVIFLVGLALM